MKLEPDTSALQKALVDAIRGIDYTPLYRQIGEYMIRSIDKNFRQGGRYGTLVAGQWTGGTTKWKLSYRAKRDQGQTLIDTGRLVGSITYVATPNGVQVGTNVEYGIKHQKGLGVEPRPFLVIQEDDKREIQRLFTAYVAKALASR